MTMQRPERIARNTEHIDKMWRHFQKTFNIIVHAETKEEKNDAAAAFKAEYSDEIWQPALQYIDDKWLNNDTAQYFLYSQDCMHFGQLTTSRNESAHWMLKRDLQVSANDLLETWVLFDRTIRSQHTTITQIHEDDKVNRPLQFVRDPLFRVVLNHVSSYALGKVLKIKNRFLGPGAIPFDPECTGHTK